MQAYPKHISGCCSAYGSWQSKTCVTFSCALIDQTQVDGEAEQGALSFVRPACEIAERNLAENGPIKGGLLGGGFLAKLSALWAPDGTSATQLSGDIRMDAVALRVLFERHFKKRAQGGDAPTAGSGKCPEADHLA